MPDEFPDKNGKERMGSQADSPLVGRARRPTWASRLDGLRRAKGARRGRALSRYTFPGTGRCRTGP